MAPCCRPPRDWTRWPLTWCSGLADARISCLLEPSRTWTPALLPARVAAARPSDHLHPHPMTSALSSSWSESLGGISEGAGSVTSPADGCRPATLVLTPHGCFLQVSLKMPCPGQGDEVSAPEIEATAFHLQSSWSSDESLGPRGVNSDHQSSWQGPEPSLGC